MRQGLTVIEVVICIAGLTFIAAMVYAIFTLERLIEGW